MCVFHCPWRTASVESPYNEIQGRHVIRFSRGCFGTFALAALVAVSALVAGCGSGAVSAPPTPPTPQPIVINPSTATLYSDTPSTFIITGGNGTFIITSSDQSALPVAGTFTGGNQFVVVPNEVAADTPVTLTVRDTGTSTPVTAALTVKPKTVSNVVTVTPSTSDCGTAVCSAGDAQVSVKLSLNGLPLANRTVRFDVVSGNFAVITSPAGVPESTSLSGTTVTDASGVASMRIRVAVDAPSQTGLMQITDVSSGSTQRVSFLIAQNTGASAGFFVTPTTMNFTGPNSSQCSTGLSGDVFVFGGVPPYTVANTFPQFVSVSTTMVPNRGGKFTVTTLDNCLDSGVITVRDSAGRTASLTVSNKVGTLAVPPLTVAPTSVTLDTCDSSASVVVAGGTGTFIVTSGSGDVIPTISGSTITVFLGSGPSPASPVNMAVTDGQHTATFQVNVTQGLTCP
jgi:hypothetical protein